MVTRYTHTRVQVHTLKTKKTAHHSYISTMIGLILLTQHEHDNNFTMMTSKQ